jgi:hypothetical protein
VQFFHLRLAQAFRLATSRKHIRYALNSLSLPSADLVRMNLMLGGKLLDRFVAAPRFERDLRFELI